MNKLLAILILLLILIGLAYMWPFTKKPKILETRDFSCEGMTGFTFKYPVFENWENVSIEPVIIETLETKEGTDVDFFDPNSCIISIRWSGNTGIQPTPIISIEISKLDLREFKNLERSPVKLNPNKIQYWRDDKSVEFYGDSFGVRIKAFSKDEHSPDFFFQTVIESFRMIETSPYPGDSMLKGKINQQVTLEGLALDAASGAVLFALGSPEEPIYVEGLDFWDSNLVNKEVQVTGKLVKKKYIPDPTNSPASQGAAGEQYVIEKTQWQLKP